MTKIEKERLEKIKRSIVEAYNGYDDDTQKIFDFGEMFGRLMTALEEAEDEDHERE